MKEVVFFFAIFITVHCLCPSGFELVRDGECRGKYTTINSNWNDASVNAAKICHAIRGQPVIIHNDEHQSYWQSRVPPTSDPNKDVIFLGIFCNTTTKRWMWADGSTIDYRPTAGYTRELDQACVTGWGWDLHANGFWHNAYGPDVYAIDIYCTTQLQQPVGDSCDSFIEDSDDGICYQVRLNAQTWQDAQTTCRNLGATVASVHNQQENQLIRKAAVAQGAVNGVYLGATSPSNTNTFAWIDRTPFNYLNFYPGFPIYGKGQCLAMDTFSSSGEWLNVDCSKQMGVACAKKTEPRHECTDGPWKKGQVIYSPGYPYDASEPCDYFLSVAPGKRVRVEVLMLEANTCCDRLIMQDNVIAGNIVANLSGEISGKYYTTQSSNIMRVSWQPNGGVNVRGAVFTFTAV